MSKWLLVVLVVLASLWGSERGHALRAKTEAMAAAAARADAGGRHLRATYSPLHFSPVAERASDEECLACHGEVLTDRVRPATLAGLRTDQTQAWYQQTSAYTGEQDTFHRRHLIHPAGRRLMHLSCAFCHRGHDPREEVPGSSADAPEVGTPGHALRKQVDVETICLRCHGRFPHEVMGLPGPWHELADSFPDGCLSCHATIRTERHRVNYLDAAAIEAAGRADSEVCHGCHGGRAWYRIAYPYPRHPWPGMADEVPAWAIDRPTRSAERDVSPPARP